MQKYKKSVDSRKVRLNPQPTKGRELGNVLLIFSFLIFFLLLFSYCAHAQTTAQWDSIVIAHQGDKIYHRPPIYLSPDTLYHVAFLMHSKIIDVRTRGSYTRVISRNYSMQDFVHKDTAYFHPKAGKINIRVGMLCVENPNADYIRRQGDLLLRAHDGRAEAEYLRRQGYSEKAIRKFQAKNH